MLFVYKNMVKPILVVLLDTSTIDGKHLCRFFMHTCVLTGHAYKNKTRRQNDMELEGKTRRAYLHKYSSIVRA